MAESFVLPKAAIIKSFVSLTFLPEQTATENDLFQICQNILQSFGIQFQDFSYTISEFFIRN